MQPRWHRPEPHVLAALLLAVLVGWALVQVGFALVRGPAPSMDTWLMATLRPPAGPALGSPKVEAVARDITALGSPVVLTSLVIAVASGLGLARRWGAALFLVLATGGGSLLSTALKAWVDRPRPDLSGHGDLVHNASFPSGHAMGAMVVYLTLAALLAPLLPSRALERYLMALAALLALAIGASRVLLGVHWPSDVLAGWAAGLAWALLCWAVADMRGLFQRPSA